ncbi:MAG TPA: tyrosine-protein phosphatase [Humisphaera sp.]
MNDVVTPPPSHAATRDPSARPLIKRTLVLWTGIGLIVLGVAAFAVYWRFSTYHLETVDQGKLYRSGLQSFREFQNGVRQVKAKTIVSLVDDNEIVDEEKPQFGTELATYADANKGVTVVRVPIKLGGWPEGDEVERFLAVAQDPAKQPVLVHCAQGVRRTGMMAAAYQLTVLGYDKERVKRELPTFGHSDRTVGDIKRFVDAYDPQARRMKTALPQSKE